MIKFSYYDCQRSIPNLVDGLKPSQRKIIFAAFNKFKSAGPSIKVSQFAAYTSETTDYHHGEESLC